MPAGGHKHSWLGLGAWATQVDASSLVGIDLLRFVPSGLHGSYPRIHGSFSWPRSEHLEAQRHLPMRNANWSASMRTQTSRRSWRAWPRPAAESDTLSAFAYGRVPSSRSPPPRCSPSSRTQATTPRPRWPCRSTVSILVLACYSRAARAATTPSWGHADLRVHVDGLVRMTA